MKKPRQYFPADGRGSDFQDKRILVMFASLYDVHFDQV